MDLQFEDQHFQYSHQQLPRYFFLKKLAYPFVNLFYHLLVSFIPHQRKDYKYKFSLVLIFKDESPYLKEWIEYHLMLGIDHFYLYQNNSTDDYISVIQPYLDSGKITMTEWSEYPGQYTAYLHWYKTFRHETEWVSFIDADEFLCPFSDLSMPMMMKRYEKFPVILVYWKLFGTNGLLHHDSDKLVIEQYTCCRPKLFTEGKVIYHTCFDAASDFISMHELKVKWHGITIPPANTFKKFVFWNIHRVNRKNQAIIQLNHYWSKAFDCWQRKYKKGSIEKGWCYKNYDFFEKLEVACTSSDFSIYRFLIKLKLRMNPELRNKITN